MYIWSTFSEINLPGGTQNTYKKKEECITHYKLLGTLVNVNNYILQRGFINNASLQYISVAFLNFDAILKIFNICFIGFDLKLTHFFPAV